MKAPSLRVRLLRLSGLPAARLTFFALVALFVLLPVLERGGAMNEFHDAQFLSAYERHARLTVRGYGELPLWDPYTCGGLYGLAAPQTRYASPFFLLSLLLGVDRAGSMLLFLTAILGMEGTYAYARHRGARRVPAMLFAPIAACHGFYAFAFHFGWLQFASFQLVPFMMLGLRRALRGETRGAVMLALSTAIATGIGGTYTLPMALVPMLVELVSALLPSPAQKNTDRGSRARATRLLRGAFVGLMLTLAVGAYRLLPLFEAVPSTLRVMGGLPFFSVRTVAEYLFVVPTEEYSLAGQYYVGIAAVAVIPALFARRARAVWVMLAVAVALAFGHFSDAAPFALLRKLPLYDMMRYPERNLVFVGFAVSVLAALGASTLHARARLRRKKPLAWLAAALCLVGLVSVVELAHLARTWTTFMHVVPSPEERAGTFRQARGNRWILSHYVETGLGSLNCGEAYPVHMSTKLRGDLPAEEYLADPSVGSVRRLAWSPNRITLDVTLRAPAHVRVNQNYHPSWKSDVGRVVSDDGLLAVALPAGHHRVVLAFRPTSALFGALGTLAGLAVCVWLYRRRSLDGRTMLVSAAPVVAMLLLEGVLGDPLPRYPEPRTRDGDRVVLDALPRTATPLDVTFDTGLALVGYEPIERTGPSRGKVTLYFRRTGRVPASVAVFLHVRGAGEGRGDHPALSAIVYPSRAPLGRVVRDEVDIDLPPALNGVLTVSTGLWHAYGDQTRVRILRAHGARTHDDAVVLELR